MPIKTVSYLSGEAEIWLDTEAGKDYGNGIRLSVAQTYEHALQQAREKLEAALDHVIAMQAAASAPPEMKS